MSQTATWLTSLRPLILGLMLTVLLAACGRSESTPGPASTVAPGVDATPTATPTSAPATPCQPERDREVLVTLYNATGGVAWEHNDNWLSDAPLGEWRGVETDDNGCVIRLGFTAYRLSGEIPAELGKLANLEWLGLDRNELTGPIPPELGNLANLEFLDIEKNEVTGEIPAELASLANLQVLYLGENQLRGEIPPELGNRWHRRKADRDRLVMLKLNDNQLTGGIPQEIAYLPDLETLEFRNNLLTGCVPQGLVYVMGLYIEGLPWCPPS